MKQVTISVDGRDYPCRVTMGAMLRFKRETGREVTSLKGDEMSLLAVWLWCCIASASKHDGVEFTLSVEDFADSVTPEVLQAWQKAVEAENPTTVPTAAPQNLA